MQILNESIAREANREDGCSGRFWEGRYESQALLDEAALATCMAYVDLNPIRAKLADTPEKSEHTSVQRRFERAGRASVPNHPRQQPAQLMPFAGNPRQDAPFGLRFRLTDYLQLIDWTGRVIRDSKRGVIPADTPVIVERNTCRTPQRTDNAATFQITTQPNTKQKRAIELIRQISL